MKGKTINQDRILVEQALNAFGLIRFRIRPRAAMGAHTFLSAKSEAQAWAKFVTLQFRGSVLKPDRQDYVIERAE